MLISAVVDVKELKEYEAVTSHLHHYSMSDPHAVAV